jgi:hypothetical protein
VAWHLRQYISQTEVRFCGIRRGSQCGFILGFGIRQAEEAPSSSSPIGEWENEVFDFYPNGGVKFLGASPYRGPLMNSFDMDRLGTA